MFICPADVQHKLMREASELRINGVGVVGHSKGHAGLIGALQFDMNERAGSSFTEKIDSLLASAGERAVAPLLYLVARWPF